MEDITVNFGKLFAILKKNLKYIIISSFFFGGIGVGFSFLFKEEFETTGRILPELQGKSVGSGLGQFAGLANMAGIDLSSFGSVGVDAVRPDLYPDIFASTPFYLDLFKSKVRTRENKVFTFEDYYLKVIEDEAQYSEKELELYPIKDSSIIIINKVTNRRLLDLQKRISSTIDRKSGVITIKAKMPDPVVAADVTKFAMDYLMHYVKNYRTKKLRQDVEFLGSQVSSSRGKFYSNQVKRAKYTDSFNDIMLQSADVQRERIESEYKLSSTFYNELLKKYEEAKFKLQQETPVFQVLDPPVAPTKKMFPKRSYFLITFAVFGLFVSVLFVLLRGKKYLDLVEIENS